MLVITRKQGEKIYISIPGRERPIVITLLNGKVKIGIEADQDISVVREEIYFKSKFE